MTVIHVICPSSCHSMDLFTPEIRRNVLEGLAHSSVQIAIFATAVHSATCALGMARKQL